MLWEQGMGQVSFHTKDFPVKTVMDAKALLNVARSTESLCAAMFRARASPGNADNLDISRVFLWAEQWSRR